MSLLQRTVGVAAFAAAFAIIIGVPFTHPDTPPVRLLLDFAGLYAVALALLALAVLALTRGERR